MKPPSFTVESGYGLRPPRCQGEPVAPQNLVKPTLRHRCTCALGSRWESSMKVLPQGEAAPVAAKAATREANEEAAKGAEPIWFASYPAGVPRTIDPDRFPSL